MCSVRPPQDPLGICQIGKAFRNEITPGNFTFRTREFEQMKWNFSVSRGPIWNGSHIARILQRLAPVARDPGTGPASARSLSGGALVLFPRDDRFEFRFPFGWGELWGIADRTDYDLKRHMEHSREDLSYFYPATNEKYVPYVVEPSLGADRMALAFFVRCVR
jgi:glycyl-tRNA synthetase